MLTPSPAAVRAKDLTTGKIETFTYAPRKRGYFFVLFVKKT